MLATIVTSQTFSNLQLKLYTLLPISPYFPHPQPLATTLFLWVWLFSPTYKWYHAVFVFLCLAYIPEHNALKVHACCPKWQDFLLSHGWTVFYCIYVPHLFPVIHQWILILFPFLGYCEYCCSEHGSTDISSISCFHFLQIYTLKWETWIIW